VSIAILCPLHGCPMTCEQPECALLAHVKELETFVVRVAKQKPEKPDYWSSCGQCEHNASDAQELLDACTNQPKAPHDHQKS
jgi:hypothetical protein